jgi:hypothetical protein
VRYCFISTVPTSYVSSSSNQLRLVHFSPQPSILPSEQTPTINIRNLDREYREESIIPIVAFIPIIIRERPGSYPKGYPEATRTRGRKKGRPAACSSPWLFCSIKRRKGLRTLELQLSGSAITRHLANSSHLHHSRTTQSVIFTHNNLHLKASGFITISIHLPNYLSTRLLLLLSNINIKPSTSSTFASRLHPASHSTTVTPRVVVA